MQTLYNDFFWNNLLKDCLKSVLFLCTVVAVVFLICSFMVLNFSNSPKIMEYSSIETVLSSSALDIKSLTDPSFDSAKILIFSCFSNRKLNFRLNWLAIKHRPPSPLAAPIMGTADGTVSRAPSIASVEVVNSKAAWMEWTILMVLRYYINSPLSTTLSSLPTSIHSLICKITSFDQTSRLFRNFVSSFRAWVREKS